MKFKKMSIAKTQKKFCRACLKEIRNAAVVTNLLDPPTPIVQLREGVKATSYLQCYLYVCLRNNSKHFNTESLSDYSYICTKCKGNLMKAVDFIATSQRNEDFLITMYDNSTHDSTFADLGDDLGDGLDDANLKDNTDMEEEYLDNIDGSICASEIALDLQDTDSNCEVDVAFEIETEENHKVDNNVNNNESAPTADGIEVNLEEDSTEKQTENLEGIEGFEQVIIDTRKDECVVKSSVKINRVKKLPLEKGEHHNDARKKKLPATKKKFLCFKCELCRKVFKLERHLYEHYDNEHDQRSLSFPCDICKNRHISEKSLMFHKRRIHKNIDYEDCQVCGKLILSAFFKTHRERHNNDIKYVCENCDRKFGTKLALNKHDKAVHGECKVRRYECPDCDRYFFSPNNLKLHATVHEKNNSEKESELLCDICSKTFTNQSKLKVHIQTHRGETMKCPHCEKEFVKLRDMQIHIRFHTKEFPFKCVICSRRFAIKTHLDHHRKQHEGVRYKCHICDKEFGHSFSLRQHSYQHRGYPLTCKICSRGFPSLFKVRRHVKNAHSNLFGVGEYSDSLAEQYYQRNQIGKMYPPIEYLEDNDY